MTLVRLGSMAAIPDIPGRNLLLYASLDYTNIGSLTGPTFGFVYVTGSNEITLQKNRFYMTPSISESYSVWESKLNTLSNAIGDGGTAFWYSFTDPLIGITNFGNCGYWYGGTGDYYFRINASAYGLTRAYFSSSENALILEKVPDLTTVNINFPNCVTPDGSLTRNPEHKGVWGLSFKFDTGRSGASSNASALFINGFVTPSYVTVTGISGAGPTYQNFLFDSMNKCSTVTKAKAPFSIFTLINNANAILKFYDGITFYVVTDGIKNDSIPVISPTPRGNTYWSYRGVTTGNTLGISTGNINSYFGSTAGFLKIKNIPLGTAGTSIMAWFFLPTFFNTSYPPASFPNIAATPLLTGYHSSSGINPMLCWPYYTYAPTGTTSEPERVTFRRYYGTNIEQVVSRVMLGRTGGSWVFIAGRATFSNTSSGGVIDVFNTVNQNVMNGSISDNFNPFSSQNFGYTSGYIADLTYFPYSSMSNAGSCGFGWTGVMDLNIGAAYDNPFLTIDSNNGSGTGKFFETNVGDIAVYNTYLSDQEIANFYAATVGKYFGKENI